MITLIAQGPSLQRRPEVPCSCQSTADFCWLPPWSRFPLWEAPGLPVLPGCIGQRIPHLLVGPSAHHATEHDQGHGDWEIILSSLCTRAFWQQPPGCACLLSCGLKSWMSKVDKWNHQCHDGTVCKRLWDTENSLLALIAMAIIAMLLAFPHSPRLISTFWIFMF